jgi:hypothetical protein
VQVGARAAPGAAVGTTVEAEAAVAVVATAAVVVAARRSLRPAEVAAAGASPRRWEAAAAVGAAAEPSSSAGAAEGRALGRGPRRLRRTPPQPRPRARSASSAGRTELPPSGLRVDSRKPRKMRGSAPSACGFEQPSESSRRMALGKAPANGLYVVLGVPRDADGATIRRATAPARRSAIRRRDAPGSSDPLPGARERVRRPLVAAVAARLRPRRRPRPRPRPATCTTMRASSATALRRASSSRSRSSPCCCSLVGLPVKHAPRGPADVCAYSMHRNR